MRSSKTAWIPLKGSLECCTVVRGRQTEDTGIPLDPRDGMLRLLPTVSFEISPISLMKEFDLFFENVVHVYNVL